MARILRVSIKGQLPNGEEWSVNPVYSVGGDFGVPVSATQANTIATAIAAVVVPTGLLQAMSTSTNVLGCRVEARGLDGALESLAEANKAVATAGTGASPHPYQTSAVISLRTATPGASGRGRLYWPATAAAIDTASLRITAAFHPTLLAAAKTYLSGIETAIEATLTGVALAVWSRLGTGSVSVVTSLNVGNVFDVQRRRRDTLVETYLTTTFP
jgi:hypothetical protein